MRRATIIGTLGFLALFVPALITCGAQGPDRPDAQEPRGFEDRGRAERFGPQEMGWGHGRQEFGGGIELLRLADTPQARTFLNLSDEQVSKLHHLAVEAEKSSVRTRADIELRGIELRELLRADNPERDAILKKVDEISALRGQRARQKMETLLAARNVLTPEQQKKVRTFLEERRIGGFRRERGMERGEGHGRPMAHPGAPAWLHNQPPAPAPPAHPGEPPVQ